MSTVATNVHEEQIVARTNWVVWGKIVRKAMVHRRAMYTLIGCALLLAASDALLTVVLGGIIRVLQTDGSATQLSFWIAYYSVLSLLFCVSVAGFIYAAGKITTYVGHDIRQEGFAKLQDLSFAYYDKRSTGWLITRLTSDCKRVSHIMAWGTLDIFWGTSVLLFFSIIMLVLNWKLALWVLSVLPVLALASLYFRNRMLTISRKVRKCNSIITATFNESITGVRTTKTLVREQGNLEEFEQISEEMRSLSVRNALYSAAYWPVATTLGSLAVGLTLWLGGNRLLGGEMELSRLVVFISCAGHLAFPVQQLARLLALVQAATAAAERVVDLLETVPEIQDSPEVLAAIAKNHAAPQPATAIDGQAAGIETVEFRDVTFEYKKDQPVLENFSLTVAAGQTIALVGPTGGGKTTVVSLLCRFYEPTNGQILINGVDYRKRSLHWLQSNLGIVLQTPHLFGGTIRENIRYGRLDASDAEVEAAAKLANAHDFVSAMAAGYDTEVGEAGGRLSTGQKQLISIARAVLADPAIFVMDEATSSVDTQTEQLVQAGIETILAGRISFVIAHRLSTIRSADRILVIDGGHIIEDGDHASLLARRGRYHELYMTQFAREQQDQVFESHEQTDS